MRGISFDVAAGEVFCLLGPNGAGKTTTVEIMEGYRLRRRRQRQRARPRPGARRARAARARRHRPAEHAACRPTCRSASCSRCTPATTRTRARRDEVIELVELDAKRDERVAGLSGGQRRRLDLALGADRRPRPAVPRRADDRLRPARAPAGVGGDPLAVLARQDRLPHHPLHGRGAGARRPRRRDGARASSSRSARRPSSPGATRCRPRSASRSRPASSRSQLARASTATWRRRPPSSSPTADSVARAAPPHRLGARARRRARRPRGRPALPRGRLPLAHRDHGDRPHDRRRPRLPAPPATSLRRDLALAAWQVRNEQRAFWRNRRAAIFSFGFPIMLLLVFGLLNRNNTIDTRGGLVGRRSTCPGILAYGDRDDRVLEHRDQPRLRARLRRASSASRARRCRGGRSWPAASARPCSSTAAMCGADAGASASVVLDVHVDAVDAARACCSASCSARVAFTALGIGFVRFLPSADTAGPMQAFLVMPIAFVSNVFFPLDDAPQLARQDRRARSRSSRSPTSCTPRSSTRRARASSADDLLTLSSGS